MFKIVNLEGVTWI